MEKLILPVVFQERNRSKLTFSDTAKVRLDSETNRIELKELGHDPVTGAPVYYVPATLDLVPYVRTWVMEPAALIAWAGFWAEPAAGLPAGTELLFRIGNGTADYYWKPAVVGPPPVPAAWTAAGPTNWNTHDEIAEHIATFPVTSGKLSVTVGLRTTDEYATPWCSALDVLMSCELEPLYSLIAGTVIPELREKLRPPVDWAVKAPGGLQVSLLSTETPFNILSVSGVYDHVADPHHRSNLLSSYDPTARTIVLTTAVARGTDLWVVFIAEPEVTVNWGSQDYVEVSRIPAVVIDGIDPTYYQNIATQVTKDVHTATAHVRSRPLRLTLSFEVVLLAENTRTLLAMQGQMLKFIASHPTIKWRDLDQEISMRGAAPATRLRPDLSDKHEAVAELTLENVYIWPLPGETKKLVSRFNLSCSPLPREG